jgi:hypothetical protein
MDKVLVVASLLMAQVGPTNTIVTPPIKTDPPQQVVVVKAVSPPPRCDARPYQRLVGRTVSDLLTARLPQGTRIYRLDDPQTQPIVAGRLSVELNRSTRVRRVYCS